MSFLFRNTIKRFRRDGEMVYQHYDALETGGESVRSRVRLALNLALVCLLCLGLFFMSGSLFNAGTWWRGETSNEFSFSVIAYADTLNGQGIEQEIIESNITLPSGRLYRGAGYSRGGDSDTYYDVFWQVGSLFCAGDDIKSVTFRAQRGGFSYYDYIQIHTVDFINDSPIYRYTSHYVIDEDTYNWLAPIIGAQHDDFPSYYQAVLDLLGSGQLDSIIGGEVRTFYTRNGQIPYLVCEQTDANGHGQYDAGYDETLPTHYELKIVDGQAEQYASLTGSFVSPEVYWELGKSVTVLADECVRYVPPADAFVAVTTTQGEADFVSIETDTIYVIATSTSGAVLTRAIIVSFDETGALCARIDADNSDDPNQHNLITTVGEDVGNGSRNDDEGFADRASRLNQIECPPGFVFYQQGAEVIGYPLALVSIQGSPGSAEYLAAQEWVIFYLNYDQDKSILYSLAGSPSSVDPKCGLYGAYSQEMADKLLEIVDKYGLVLHSDYTSSRNDGRPSALLGTGEYLGITNKAFSASTIYEDGSFGFEGLFDFGNGRCISYQLRNCQKGVMNNGALNIGSLEGYEFYSYQTINGVYVMVVYSQAGALIIADFEHSFLGISLRADSGIGEFTLDDYLKMADSFDYSVLQPGK